MTDKRSDFVAQIALTAFQDWSSDLAVQWDPQEPAQRAHAVRTCSTSRRTMRCINLSYRYERFQEVPEFVGRASCRP